MRAVALALTAVLTTLALTGCSEEPSDAQSSIDGGRPSVTLTFEDGQAPSPERMQAEVGQKVDVIVKSDAKGTLHVHSDPEEEFPYGSGTTTVTLVIDEPGVVDVESHELEATVLQIEVS